jgi:hypothetical protein
MYFFGVFINSFIVIKNILMRVNYIQRLFIIQKSLFFFFLLGPCRLAGHLGEEAELGEALLGWLRLLGGSLPGQRLRGHGRLRRLDGRAVFLSSFLLPSERREAHAARRRGRRACGPRHAGQRREEARRGDWDHLVAAAPAGQCLLDKKHGRASRDGS